jgi:hypothetical protein
LQGSNTVDYLVVAGGAGGGGIIQQVVEVELVDLENLLVLLLVVTQISFRSMCFSFTRFIQQVIQYSRSWWFRRWSRK